MFSHFPKWFASLEVLFILSQVLGTKLCRPLEKVFMFLYCGLPILSNRNEKKKKLASAKVT